MRREQVINWDPDILGGTPVFADTRVPVQTLIDYLKAGDSLNDFLEGFPSVSREQAQAFFGACARFCFSRGKGCACCLTRILIGG